MNHKMKYRLPVTSSVPDGSCLRNTTRFPRKRPERRIRTVPGLRLLRSFVGLCFWGAALALTSSPAYHLGAFAWGWGSEEITGSDGGQGRLPYISSQPSQAFGNERWIIFAMCVSKESRHAKQVVFALY